MYYCKMSINKAISLSLQSMIQMNRIKIIYNIAVIIIWMITQSKFQIRNLNINQANKKTNWNKDPTAVSIWGIFKEFKAI